MCIGTENGPRRGTRLATQERRVLRRGQMACELSKDSSNGRERNNSNKEGRNIKRGKRWEVTAVQ